MIGKGSGASVGKWGRRINANDANSALTVNQRGSGNIISLQDGGVATFTVADGGIITTGDNILVRIGADGDSALVLSSAGVAANTVLAGVLVGTPVTPIAIAANSLIEANITASGDIVLAVNKGGNSYMAFMADASTGDTLLGVPTGQSVDFYIAGAKVLDYAVALAAITPAVSVLDATAATSALTGALRVAGGAGIAGDFWVGGNAVIGVANKQMKVQNPTNAGVQHVGGLGVLTGILDNQSFTITIGICNAAIVIVGDDQGRGAAFFVSYLSATIVELADPSGIWATTDVDGNPGWAIYKGASTNVVTIKNYNNATRQLYINILGVVASATAPA